MKYLILILLAIAVCFAIWGLVVSLIVGACLSIVAFMLSRRNIVRSKDTLTDIDKATIVSLVTEQHFTEIVSAWPDHHEQRLLDRIMQAIDEIYACAVDNAFLSEDDHSLTPKNIQEASEAIRLKMTNAKEQVAYYWIAEVMIALFEFRNSDGPISSKGVDEITKEIVNHHYDSVSNAWPDCTHPSEVVDKILSAVFEILAYTRKEAQLSNEGESFREPHFRSAIEKLLQGIESDKIRIAYLEISEVLISHYKRNSAMSSKQ